MNWAKFIITLLLSWFPFMCVHELGHILSAKINHGTIEEVKLIPWEFSHTIINNSHHPLMDVWAGPIVGCFLPLVIWLLTRNKNTIRFYTGSFAGFCFLANGLYIGLGWIDKVGDTGDIIRNNGNIASMVIFGFIACVSAFMMWHHTLEADKKVINEA